MRMCDSENELGKARLGRGWVAEALWRIGEGGGKESEGGQGLDRWRRREKVGREVVGSGGHVAGALPGDAR